MSTAGLDRDIEEFYNEVNELINKIEVEIGDECITGAACFKLAGRIWRRVNKIITKITELQQLNIIDDKQSKYYSKILSILSDIKNEINNVRNSCDPDDYEEDCRKEDMLLNSLMDIQGRLEILKELLGQGSQGGTT